MSAHAVIVGAAGYTGGETLRILLHHPHISKITAVSVSSFGKPVSDVHTDLFGETDLLFSDQLPKEMDVLFLCLGHGDAYPFLSQQLIPENVYIIDLSQDFRNLDQPVAGRNWVYGLPEKNASIIREAKSIANPGCFATCIELALLPLAAQNALPDDIYINGVTGATGAGQKPTETTHFSWRQNNLSVYKAFDHQHLTEISRTLHYPKEMLHFVPMRGDFSRGILCNIQFRKSMAQHALLELYHSYYKSASFTHVSEQDVHLKQVVNTNKCIIQIQQREDRILITSVIDNLLKGAAGQAIQNMNLMLGISETSGLNLKPVAF